MLSVLFSELLAKDHTHANGGDGARGGGDGDAGHVNAGLRGGGACVGGGAGDGGGVDRDGHEREAIGGDGHIAVGDGRRLRLGAEVRVAALVLDEHGGGGAVVLSSHVEGEGVRAVGAALGHVVNLEGAYDLLGGAERHVGSLVGGCLDDKLARGVVGFAGDRKGCALGCGAGVGRYLLFVL